MLTALFFGTALQLLWQIILLAVAARVLSRVKDLLSIQDAIIVGLGLNGK